MVTKSKTTTGKKPARKTAAAKKPATRSATRAAAAKPRVSAAAKGAGAKARTAAAPPAGKAAPKGVTRPAPVPAPAPAPAPAPVPVPVPAAMRKKQLIDMVVARSGIKKKDAKPVIEAMLAVLGEAIDAGEGLNLPPFGKVKVQRHIDKSAAKVSIVRIRQAKPRSSAQPSSARPSSARPKDQPKDPLHAPPGDAKSASGG